MRARNFSGWRRSRPDHRDLVLPTTAKKLPSSASVRDLAPRVEDQGQIGSCTAHATTSAMEFLYKKKGIEQPELSRLFLYYSSRVWVEGTRPSDDSGCEIRDVMKAAHKYGTPVEVLWPYDASAFAARPTESVISSAKMHQLLKYYSVSTLRHLKSSIVGGYPVVIGFSVPENMESRICERTGIVSYPSPNEQIIGGHAVLAVGYDDRTGLVCFQNSWGSEWGDAGFGYLPYSFWGSSPLVDDCWTARDEEY